MKLLAILFVFFVQSAFAMPYVCESKDTEDGLLLLRFKINDKVPVKMMNNTWDMYLIGVTPAKSFRHIVYAQGTLNEKSLHLTFVKDSFVIGSLGAEIQKDGSYLGEARISSAANGQTLEVVCHDEGTK